MIQYLAIIAKLNHCPSVFAKHRQKQRRRGKHMGRKLGSFKLVEQLKFEYPKVIKYLEAGTYTIREIAQLAALASGTVMKVKKSL